jgi:hypothetical protein
MNLKQKRMTLGIIILYFSVILVIFFVSGGFYFTKKLKTELSLSKQIGKEFIQPEKTGAVEGTYSGIINHNGKAYYGLQFHGLLSGENRYLNIYQSIEKGVNPYVFESQTPLSGKPAFIMKVNNDNDPNTPNLYHALFKEDNYTTPSYFLTAVGLDKITFNDTLILLSYDLLSYPLFGEMNNAVKTEMIVWTQNPEGIVSAYRNIDLMYANENEGNCRVHINKPGKWHENLQHVWWGLVDVLTAPIQLITLLFYFLMVLIAGGPVK